MIAVGAEGACEQMCGGGLRAVRRTDDHERRSQRRDREPEDGTLPMTRSALLEERTQVRDGRLARRRRVDEGDLLHVRSYAEVGQTSGRVLRQPMGTGSERQVHGTDRRDF